MKRICSHAATVLSVMTVVFLCIHNVNNAMAFYNHPFTKIILLLLAALLCVNTASLGLAARICAIAYYNDGVRIRAAKLVRHSKSKTCREGR